MINTPSIDSGLIAFAPRARLLKLLGAELISDEVVAITELVKNAHDADATFVSIQFNGVTQTDGEILVRDDGQGMALDTLLTRWMQPAGSSKGRDATRYTATGRRTLGEKGVGRFAADKLAARLELVSRCRDEDREVRSVFDWDEFDHDERMLSDVRSRWELRAPDWLENHGTVLKMTGLRSLWNERMFRRLSARLSRLVSPFSGQPRGFKILIESDEFPEYAGEVGGGYLDAAPYRVEAEFDGSQGIAIRLNGGRAVKQSWTGDEPLGCGPVRVRLYAFDLETEALARLGPRTDVRAWLKEWSGVSIYRDSFRVWPYGEPHDDWLRLDQRRINNPVMRVSNNQIVGFVEISGDANFELRDQTNREGLLHNPAFADLQRFVLHTMQIIETERQAVRHPSGGREDRRLARSASAPGVVAIPDALDKIAARAGGEMGAELRRASARARNQIGAQEASKRRLLDGYSDLAALGHSAALVGRTVAIGLEDIRQRFAVLRHSLSKKRLGDLERVLKDVDDFEAAFASVSSRLLHVSASVDTSTKRRRGLDVATELEAVRDMLRPLLDHEDAVIDIHSGAGAVLRTEMRPEAFAAVINALVRNSLEWRARSHALRISITVRAREDELTILFSDNGKGVSSSVRATLFEAMVTGREGAAGMGLTLTRHVIMTHGGRIELLTDKRRKGATFEISLPRKKSRATA